MIAPSRRTLLSWFGLGSAAIALGACSRAEAKAFPVMLSDAEWKRKLTGDQYYILRQAGTERAFTSPLDKEKRKGMFHCAGCDNAVYASAAKYDSKTGWPSFWKAADTGAVGTSTDYKIGYPRTEVHCADCGGHLGHIFDDGPRPTGKRHCINGAALRFRPG